MDRCCYCRNKAHADWLGVELVRMECQLELARILAGPAHHHIPVGDILAVADILVVADSPVDILVVDNQNTLACTDLK